MRVLLSAPLLAAAIFATPLPVLVPFAGPGNLAQDSLPTVVVLSTGGTIASTHSGRVLPLYAGGGGGSTLHEIGCVYADNLSAQKARVLLIAALTRTRAPEELRAYFSR